LNMLRNSVHKAEIVIIGGGLAGLSFANLLAAGRPELGPVIAVIERTPPPELRSEVGVRVSALSPGSAALGSLAAIFLKIVS